MPTTAQVALCLTHASQQEMDSERQTGHLWQNWDLNPDNISANLVSVPLPTPSYASRSAEVRQHMYLYKCNTL